MNWYSVIVFWKTGEITTLWTVTEDLAWEIASNLFERDQNKHVPEIEKIRIVPPKGGLS